MLVKLLTQHDGEIQVTFPELEGTAAQLVECASYQALVKIQNILRDDTLSDPECFQKIEEVLCVLESLGAAGRGGTITADRAPRECHSGKTQHRSPPCQRGEGREAAGGFRLKARKLNLKRNPPVTALRR